MDAAPEQRIGFIPRQCGGHVRWRGMRFRVADVPDMLAGGVDLDVSLADFPDGDRADLQAGLSFAAPRADIAGLAV